jgi:uncharacterized integral membrane protein (TIGR00697 family)
MKDADTQPLLRYYDVVASMFVAIYLISLVATTKIVALGSFQVPGALIIFPISYLAGDILTEVYGYARTRRVIWLGFIAAALLSLVLYAVQLLPAAPGWEHQAAYEAILGVVPRITIASLIAYWAGEFANSFVLAKMKIWTNGRMLWTRTIGSTIIGQAVDSIVFGTAAFAGVLPAATVFTIVGSLYLLKVLYEIIATPFTYAAVNFLKRQEGIDTFDRKTAFTPFRF